MSRCVLCGSEDTLTIDSLKHIWEICCVCRCAKSSQKERYIFDFAEPILRPYFRKKRWFQTEQRILKHNSVIEDNTKMWDYFLDESHIQYSREAADEFYKDVFLKNNFEVANKDILDISGGGGDFVAYFLTKGANSVALSEYNNEVVAKAKERIGIPAFFYDCNNEQLERAIYRGLGCEMKFDYIMMRGTIMWSLDIEQLLRDCKACLKDGGKIIIDDCVITTLGAIMTVQFDEYAYLRMYSPEYVGGICEKLSLRPILSERKASGSMVPFWYDRYPVERCVRRFYEAKAVRKLQFSPDEFKRLEFNARDIRMYRLIFEV